MICGRNAVGIVVQPDGREIPVCENCQKMFQSVEVLPIDGNVEPIDRLCQCEVYNAA